jgi:cation:H+ antiporter
VKALALELLADRGPLVPGFALLVVGVLVFLVAARLARAADVIATETGLGGLWTGTLALAAATSLPEVLTGLNAGLLEVPDIGVGDVIGANLANLLILAVLDLVFARRRILHAVAEGHAQVGLLGLLLMALVALAILGRGWGRLGHLGLDTIAVAAVYVGGLRLLHRRDPAQATRARPASDRGGAGTLRTAGLGFAGAALGLAALAPLLVLSAEAVAREAGLSATFVGTLLVGLTTTAPEMAATVSAVRLGALDLAVGNVFGSVSFNMLVLAVVDAAYGAGPVLAAVSRDHVLTLLLGILCLALGLMGILSRAAHRPGPARLESALIVAAYAGGMWLLAVRGAP